MSRIKIKLRFIFSFIILLSISILVYLNVNGTTNSSFVDQSYTVSFIFLISLIIILYIVFEAYCIMYKEMTERVAIITASKNDLQTTYNSISMLLIEIGSDNMIINVNESTCKYLKKKKGHIVGKRITNVLQFEKSTLKVLNQMVDKSFKDNVNVKGELENAGNIFEVSVFLLQDSPDSIKKVLLMLNDVTQERASYRQMLQDNKMSAVGQLAAGIAHEIRNPLGLIRTYSHLLKKRHEEPEIREKALEMIDYAVNRSSGIIDNLLSFSRISDDTWSEVQIQKTIDAIIELEEHEFKSRNIDVVVNCNSNLSFKTIVESLQVILMNLIINAIDAIDQNGLITIECQQRQSGIVFNVRDNGAGIPPDIQSEIFNPFFTTKEYHKGSGLGLYIVYNEIAKLNGKIEVQSIEGEGASFIVTLPMREGEESFEK